MLKGANQSVPEGVHVPDQATNVSPKGIPLLRSYPEYLAYKLENVDGEFLDLVAVAFMLAPNESNTTGVAHDRGRLYAREIIRPLALTSGFGLWPYKGCSTQGELARS